MTPSPVLNLLVSNDDGIFSQGVRTLANTLAAAGHRVTVVCPDRERSATGHGLTLHRPIRAGIVEDVFDPRITAWSCSGTPADCVKFALHAVMPHYPDFVLSGVNHGANLGTDVLYSGTVSAAMEGLIEGIPSVALSLVSFTATDFQPAADFANCFVQHLWRSPLGEPTLFSINIPAVPADQIAGVKLTRQGLQRYSETFEERYDPRGKRYYWLAGERVKEIPQPDYLRLNRRIPTDVQASQDNFITITPLQYNLTDINGVNTIEKNNWLEHLNFN
ncbi:MULTISPECIES: 5'/3'-nucleotidase SurE [unclassified Synechocystis]|uniref:5'/3'-nucleotidase SurE n=1 Tax=unclassified Synechocystis TaxID=2640012 RepID=UPI000403217B|nr:MULTISPECIES: 5'/3'-nucleotidase SurE [unclassified Synechocystis]AIE74203.1 5-nucleotidase SurE [Synechocystis sp. PCC 6714]MCT0252835.1 5'/3'-nucleotidase SurE [Synechocystis sp. CS-94]